MLNEPALAYHLEARRVSMRFGGVTAVDQVDFCVRPGELRCLIGPNGAGKSTFFKILSGQLRPSAGEVLFKGRRIAGESSAQISRRGMSIKTQVPSVFDEFSVFENVYLALKPHLPARRAAERTEAALERIGIAALRARLVGELAHGQRQLVELAMVVAREPDLVLLDEPAAGITGQEMERLADLILALAGSCAIIVVEHDMAFIRRIARDITVFNRGRVLAQGPAREVLADARVKDVYLGKEAA